jgi:hypothetical protein
MAASYSTFNGISGFESKEGLLFYSLLQKAVTISTTQL